MNLTSRFRQTCLRMLRSTGICLLILHVLTVFIPGAAAAPQTEKSIPRSSTMNAPTVLCDGQTLDGANGDTRLIIRDQSNVVIRNCTFRNFTRDAIVIERSSDVLIENNHFEYNYNPDVRRDTHGVNIPHMGQRIIIRNNTFVNMGGDGVQMGDSAAELGTGDIRDIEIINNSFTVTRDDIGENGIDIKTTHGPILIADNEIHGFRPCEPEQMGCTGSPGEGIVIHMGARDVTVERNRIYDNIRGISIAAGFIAIPPRNIVVRNNWIYDNPGRGLNVYEVHSLQLVNNTFVNNDRHLAIGATPTSSDGVCINTNNLFAGGPTPNTVCNPHHNLYYSSESAAGFVDAANKNFHLSTGAAPIDQGATTSLATQDFDREARPSGSAYDVGADEVVTELPDGCLQATPHAWQHVAFSEPQKDSFVVEADLTPPFAATSGAFAVANGTPNTWDGLAAIMLFDDQSRTIKVRNGAVYQDASPALPYQAGTTYHVKMEIDVANQTYSATVTPPDGEAVSLGTDLAFRETQANVTSLSHMVVAAGTNSQLTGCNLNVQTQASESCLTAVPGAWQHAALPTPQTGSFVAEADLTPPFAATSGAFAVASGTPSTWDGLAAIVLFDDQSRTIKVRNGAVYQDASPAVPYQAGTTYHVKMVVDVANQSYSATVTPLDGQPVSLGSNLAFRETQANVTSLSHMVVAAGTNSEITGCDFVAQAFDGSGPTVTLTNPTANSTLTGTVTLSAEATDATGVAGVQFFLNQQPVGTEDTTAPYQVSFDTTSYSNGSYTFSAQAHDTVGNTSTTELVAATILNPNCLTATPSNWKHTPLPNPQTGSFVAEADLTPPFTATSGAFAVASGTPSTWDGLAAIVLFDDQSRTIKVRNGAVYQDASPALPYQAGTTYHVKMVVDVANQSYSATVTPLDGQPVSLGSNLAFRETQANVTTLNHMVVAAGTNSEITGCNLIAQEQVDPTLTFAVLGDYGTGGSAEGYVAEQVKSWNPDLIVTVGDNNYSDGAAETIDANIGQFYHEFIGSYQGSYGPGATENMFFPALGNHDWETNWGDPPLPHPHLDYFTLPGNERYYDIVRGPVHFFILDSDYREPAGTRADSVQAQWLQEQLATSKAPWKIVLLHHAPYSSGAAHGSTSRVQWPFETWGADAVIAGHDHHYERILKDGFPYFVNGLGGASPRNNFINPPVSGSALRYAETWGAMRVDASPSSIIFRFITHDGTEIDSFTLHHESTSTSDFFGTAKVFQTTPDGREWQMNPNNPVDDSQLDISYGEVSWDSTLAAWKVTPTSDKIRLNVVTPRQDGAFVAPPWLNIEMTGYVRLLDIPSFDEEITFYTRGGRHNDAMPCEGTAYKGEFEFDGDVFVQKELFHGGSGAGYTDNPQKRGQTRPWSGFTVGDTTWIGLKVIVFNTQIDDQNAVQTELWVDQNGTNQWQHASTVVDLQTSTSNGFPSGDWTTNDSVPANCGWNHGYVILNGTTPNGESWATIRTDKTSILIDKLTIREINPSQRLINL